MVCQFLKYPYNTPPVGRSRELVPFPGPPMVSSLDPMAPGYILKRPHHGAKDRKLALCFCELGHSIPNTKLNLPNFTISTNYTRCHHYTDSKNSSSNYCKKILNGVIYCSKIADAEVLSSYTLQRSNHRTYEEATRQATALPLPQPHLEGNNNLSAQLDAC